MICDFVIFKKKKIIITKLRFIGSWWSVLLIMQRACPLFLPAAGYRSGSSVSGAGSEGYYWSSSSSSTNFAYRVYFNYGSMTPTNYNYRSYGCSVRLVRPVE